MKRAFLVVGPEATGTKITAQILLNCLGCVGKVTTWRRNATLYGMPDNFMVRWSIPKNNPPIWIGVSSTVYKLREVGYKCTLIVTTRNWYAMYNSHVRQDKKAGIVVRSRDEIFEKTRESYKMIFDGIKETNIPFIISNYEDMVTDPENYIKNMADLLGLPYMGYNVNIINQNKKYYSK